MKIWIQKFAICIDVVVKLKLSNPAKLSCFLFFLRKYSTSKQSIIYGWHLIRIHICALCKCKSQRNPGLKKSANHSKSKIPFDKLGYFSLSVYEIVGLKWGSLFHQFFSFQQNAKLEGKEEKTDFCKIHVKSMESKPFWSCISYFQLEKWIVWDWKHFDCC